MIYKLCASHLPEGLSFDEVLRRESALKAVGTEAFGPVRTIEADSEEEAKDTFLELYGEDFNTIKCFNTGYVHIVEE